MKRMITKLGLITAIVVITATMNVPAAERGYEVRKHHGDKGPGHPLGIKKMDANQDGRVTFAEFKAAHIRRLEKRFKRMDRNGDGVISREDRDAARQQHADRFFEQADTNGDGLLSKDEMEAAKRHGKAGKHRRN